MFRSESEQERATAARLATELLTKSNLTWTEVLTRGLQRQTTTQRQTKTARETWTGSAPANSGRRSNKVTKPPPDFALVRQLLNDPTAMDTWEKNFLRALLATGTNLHLTPRQRDIVQRIAARKASK